MARVKYGSAGIVIIGLLIAGLIVTPFILAPGASDIAREPKMAWALVFALMIGLTALYRGEFKPFKNIWALALVGFCLLSFYLSPKPELKLFGIESGRFWSWEPLYQGIVFLLFTVAIASARLKIHRLHLILSTMMWCGVVMAGFVILQACKLDQFFEHRYGTYGHMAGTLGNPTLIGPFLCLTLPIAMYRRERFLAGMIIFAVVVTRSDVALIGVLATLAAYYALRGGKWFVGILTAGVLITGVVVTAYVVSPRFREVCPDNERFLTWRQSVGDLVTPVMQDSKKIYATTGIGPGSFMYLFHAKHNVGRESFVYAHNDFVQTLYELGVIGFVLFLGTLVAVFKKSTSFETVFSGRLSDTRRVLLSSFIGILVCANGIFVLQIGTHIFYTLTIVGLLCNDNIS